MTPKVVYPQREAIGSNATSRAASWPYDLEATVNVKILAGIQVS